MNSCHACTIIPKPDHIISCDHCSNNYCLKCIKIHLNQPTIQKTFIVCNFDTIKFKKQARSWLCFACQKLCLCKACKGISLGSIQRKLLGKKDTFVVRRKIEDFQQHFQQIQLLKNMNFSQLSPFEQEYMMNKAMLYSRQNDIESSNKKPLDQATPKPASQKAAINQNVIQIESDQNVQAENKIEEKKNQEQIQEIQQQIQEDKNININEGNNRLAEPMAIQHESQVDNSELRKVPEVINAKNNNDENRIVEEPKQDITPEAEISQVKVLQTSQNKSQN